MKIKITEHCSEDLIWPFDGKPYFRLPVGSYGHSEVVDPTPCYAHNLDVVRVESDRCVATFPIDRDVTICVLHRENESRTNGHTGFEYNYKVESKDREYPWMPYIVLQGKRIPPHPAMTRYLVAHEYGHVVKQYIAKSVRKEKDGNEEAEKTVYGDYCKLRGFNPPKYYGPGTWHASISELFANDFRILVMNTEVEFWPHPGFTRPEAVPAIVEFWKKEKEAALTAQTKILEGVPS